MVDANEKIVSEETQEKQDNARYQEIMKKSEAERTEEEKKEVGELKERYGSRMQKKIDKMTARQKALEEENERLATEIEEAKKNKEIKNKEDEIPESTKNEVIEIAGKKYYTDNALTAQIKSGEISDIEAYQYQRKRDKEELKDELRKERESEDKKVEDAKFRKEDSESVIKNYPNFSKKHPDYNPEDPLYKLANELYREAYAANPKGLSLAIKRAKEILRISDEHIDGSEDHGIERSEAPERKGEKKDEITLSEYEKEAAVRQYTRGDIINPKTKRVYTEPEALAKALEAKKARKNK